MTAPLVFISHSYADRATARECAEALRSRGVSVWSDEIAPGERIQDVVRERLDKANVFVLLISPDTQDSPWVRFESSEVLKHTWRDPTRRVLPIVIGQAQLPGYLRDHFFLKISPGRASEVFDALVNFVSAEHVESTVDRTSAGDERLERRLSELQRAAAALAEAEDDA